MTQTLLQSVQQAFQAKGIPDVPLNRVKFTSPLFLNPSQMPLLRGAALEVILSSIQLCTSPEELEQLYSMLQEVLQLLETDKALMAQNEQPIFSALCHILRTFLESEVALVQLSFSFLTFQFGLPNESLLELVHSSPLMERHFLSLCAKEFLSATRKRCERVVLLLGLLSTHFSDMSSLIEPIRFLLSLGNNTLYIKVMELLALQGAEFEGVYVDCEPDTGVEALAMSWILNYGRFLLRHTQLSRQHLFDYLCRYIPSHGLPMSKEDADDSSESWLACLASGNKESNEHIITAVLKMIANSKTQSKLVLALSFAKGVVGLCDFSEAFVELLRTLAQLRDDCPAGFEYIKDIEAVFAKVARLDGLRLLAAVPLYVPASHLFRSWLIPLVKHSSLKGLDYFLSSLQPICDKFAASDPSLPVVIHALFQLFPRCLLSNVGSESMACLRESMPALLNTCARYPPIIPAVVNGVCEWLQHAYPVLPAEHLAVIAEPMCNFSFELYCSQSETSEYLLDVLPTFIRLHTNSDRLVQSLKQHIMRAKDVADGYQLVRLLEAFAAKHTSDVFAFCQEALKMEGWEERKLKALYKALYQCSTHEEGLLAHVDISKCPFIKEKLRLVALVRDDTVVQSLLPDVVFSLKDTSQKTRSIAEQVLRDLAGRFPVQRLLELLVVGLVASGTTMKAATIGAVGIVLSETGSSAPAGAVDVVLTCIYTLPFNNELMKSLIKLFSDLVTKQPSLVDAHVEKLVGFLFSPENVGCLRANMDAAKRLLAATAGVAGWERIADALPRKDKPLAKYLQHFPPKQPVQ